MARLYGWAVKISWLGADHTYVKSSDGGVWPCWGRSSGGKKICSGLGSSKRANCLSQTHSHAGIIYGVTGVCHQTSNRILYPARVVVSRARGYWASVTLYGTYGTHSVAAWLEWEARKHRCSKINGDMNLKGLKAAPKSAAKAGEMIASEPGMRAYLDKVEAMYTNETRGLKIGALPPATKTDLLARELDLMADYRLGAEKDPKKIKMLQKVQGTILNEKGRLDEALIGKDLTAAEYAKKVNALMTRLMKESAAQLGGEAHTKLFGMPADVEFNIVDVKILAPLHK